LSRYEAEISFFKACHNVERYIIGKWKRHGLARLPIGAITTDRLLPILNDYRQRYKPETIRKDFGLLCHMFNIAIEQWGVPLQGNPVQKLRLPSTVQHAWGKKIKKVP
jgi:hypothetical protein